MMLEIQQAWRQLMRGFLDCHALNAFSLPIGSEYGQ